MYPVADTGAAHQAGLAPRTPKQQTKVMSQRLEPALLYWRVAAVTAAGVIAAQEPSSANHECLMAQSSCTTFRWRYLELLHVRYNTQLAMLRCIPPMAMCCEHCRAVRRTLPSAYLPMRDFHWLWHRTRPLAYCRQAHCETELDSMVRRFSLGLCRCTSWLSVSDALDASSEHPYTCSVSSFLRCFSSFGGSACAGIRSVNRNRRTILPAWPVSSLRLVRCFVQTNTSAYVHHCKRMCDVFYHRGRSWCGELHHWHTCFDHCRSSWDVYHAGSSSINAGDSTMYINSGVDATPGNRPPRSLSSHPAEPRRYCTSLESKAHSEYHR